MEIKRLLCMENVRLLPDEKATRRCLLKKGGHLRTKQDRFGLGSKFLRLDSGSTLHVPVGKFPQATKSSCFIDTRDAYRCARNDDRRDDSP